MHGVEIGFSCTPYAAPNPLIQFQSRRIIELEEEIKVQARELDRLRRLQPMQPAENPEVRSCLHYLPSVIN